MPPGDSALQRLLLAFHGELVEAGLARRPGTVTLGVPPLFIEPADGPPAPGEKTGVEADALTMLSLMMDGEALPPPPGHRMPFLQLWFRTAGKDGNRAPSTRAFDIEEAVRDRVLGSTAVDAQRLGFRLNPAGENLFVISARVWRGLQKMGSSSGQGYTYTMSYAFEVYDEPNPWG